jgi:DNA-binding IclR family transcriptional regulator
MAQPTIPPSGTTGPRRPRHRTVDRIAEVLEAAARSPGGLTLSEFANTVSAPTSSIQGLVNGLTAAGFLVERDRRFALGPAPFLLNAIADRPVIRSVGRAEIERLHAESGMAVVLGVMMGDAVYYIDQAGDMPGYAYLTNRHIPRVPLKSSMGRAILAGQHRADLWNYLQTQHPTDSQLVEEFLAELPQIDALGVAYSPGLADSGWHGLATAVNEHDRVVAGVSIVGPPEAFASGPEGLSEILLRHREEWATRYGGNLYT